ncbi:VENN motif pre-toxin domain-containing protein, partial [Xanthomonas prunicola]
QQWGIGGDYSRALQAVTTVVVGGVSGQGAGQVATNALAPYAAQLIGRTFDQNHGSDPNAALQVLSHAVLGAVLAQVNGTSMAGGALAGAGGELAVKYLTQTLYADDPRAIDPVTGKFNPNLLPEQDKQMLVALSQAVGAIAGGLAGGSLLDASIGAQIAGNAVTNNAMLSVDEVARIKEMANGDPEKEKRLLAAACSKKKCANGLNSNDPYYAIWSALQTEGDKPEYQNEKDWLSWQSQTVKYPSGSMADALSGVRQGANVPLFNYTPFDALADWSSRNDVGTRTLGGLQMFGGAAEVAGAFVAAPICTTGFGCFAVGYVGFSGADNAISGSKTLFGGVSTPTLGGRALQMLGLSEGTAELVYGLTQLGAGLKAGSVGAKLTGDYSPGKILGTEGAPPSGNFYPGGSVDGGGSAFIPPASIPYQPKGAIILQGNAPACGPACAAMTITDETGQSVNLESAIGRFENGIRRDGVNAKEISKVLNDSGIKNNVYTNMFSGQLDQALANGKNVIVNIPVAPGKGHFVIIDGIQDVDGVKYYMTRDPFTGPRGVRKDLIERVMRLGANSIVTGE